MAKRSLELRWSNGHEELTVALDDEAVYYATQDDVGWNGLTDIASVAMILAKKAGWNIEVVEWSDEE